jgi:hypothetical protein
MPYYPEKNINKIYKLNEFKWDDIEIINYNYQSELIANFYNIIINYYIITNFINFTNIEFFRF